jgi:4-amino-4-deoxy-L-arabinose transferase-like glycosyltransferase
MKESWLIWGVIIGAVAAQFSVPAIGNAADLDATIEHLWRPVWGAGIGFAIGLAIDVIRSRGKRKSGPLRSWQK